MFGRLLPKSTSFFNFFEKHAELTIQACQELLAMAEGRIDLATAAQRIKKLEHDTDVVTHNCIDALHRTFITPFDRSDIHALIKGLDDIVDAVDAAVSRMALYEMHVIRPEARDLAQVLVKATEAIVGALRLMRNLHDGEHIKQQCIIIYEMENQGDAILRDALGRLFKESDAILVIKWKEIYERLEKASDRCEKVANIIQGIVIEAS